MSMEISSDILSYEENVDRNFQRHFELWYVMSMEISSDILSYEENVDRNFQRQFELWNVMSMEISSDIFELCMEISSDALGS